MSKLTEKLETLYKENMFKSLAGLANKDLNPHDLINTLGGMLQKEIGSDAEPQAESDHKEREHAAILCISNYRRKSSLVDSVMEEFCVNAAEVISALATRKPNKDIADLFRLKPGMELEEMIEELEKI